MAFELVAWNSCLLPRTPGRNNIRSVFHNVVSLLYVTYLYPWLLFGKGPSHRDSHLPSWPSSTDHTPSAPYCNLQENTSISVCEMYYTNNVRAIVGSYAT